MANMLLGCLVVRAPRSAPRKLDTPEKVGCFRNIRKGATGRATLTALLRIEYVAWYTSA